MMESFVVFVLWLLFGCGVLAIAWIVAGLSVPHMDYSDDWREGL